VPARGLDPTGGQYHGGFSTTARRCHRGQYHSGSVPQAGQYHRGQYHRGSVAQRVSTTGVKYHRGSVPQGVSTTGGQYHRGSVPQGVSTTGGQYHSGSVPQLVSTTGVSTTGGRSKQGGQLPAGSGICHTGVGPAGGRYHRGRSPQGVSPAGGQSPQVVALEEGPPWRVPRWGVSNGESPIAPWKILQNAAGLGRSSGTQGPLGAGEPPQGAAWAELGSRGPGKQGRGLALVQLTLGNRRRRIGVGPGVGKGYEDPPSLARESQSARPMPGAPGLARTPGFRLLRAAAIVTRQPRGGSSRHRGAPDPGPLMPTKIGHFQLTSLSTLRLCAKDQCGPALRVKAGMPRVRGWCNRAIWASSVAPCRACGMTTVHLFIILVIIITSCANFLGTWHQI